MAALKKETGKTILFVNSGGEKKKFTLECAKKLGYKIILLNAKNDAQKLATHFIEADTYNHGECVDRLQQFLADHQKIKIDGAVTFWEDDIPLLSRLCREFKWTGNAHAAALQTRNKFRMRQRLEQTGLPVPAFHLVRTENDLKEAMDEIGFPAVMKPVWGADSEFVVRVDDADDAERVFKYLKTNCTVDFNAIFHYNSGQFLYEEYISGMEVSIECIVQHGIPHAVGIAEKLPAHEPYFVERGDIAPARLTESARGRAVKIAEASLIALGVENSLGHVEMKLSPDGPYLIDIASRMGGDYLYSWVKEIWDIDLIEAGLRIATNQNVEPEWERYRQPSCTLVGRYLIPDRSGVVTKQRGLTEAQKKFPLYDVNITKDIGDTVLVPPEGFENMGWVVGKGKTHREAESQVQEFLRSIDIEVVPFRPDSSVGRTERKRALSSARITRKQLAGQAKIEKLRKIPKRQRQKLHIGILGNLYNTQSGDDAEQDLTSMGKHIEKALRKKNYNVTFFDMNESPAPFEKIRTADVDLMFNICERVCDSAFLEPCSAALLEILQVPYTGSNPETLGLCMNKIRSKQLLEYHDIPTPNWDYAFSPDDEIDRDLRYPLIVKPADTHNSIGVTNESVVTNKKELQRQIERVTVEIGRTALVEEYIEGDEYDVAIMGNDETLRVLPLTRSMFEGMPEGYWHIYAYDAKWKESKNPYHSIKVECPPKIPKKLASLITEISIDTYNIVDCHDYGRVEIRVDKDGNPFVLECNPNCSIGSDDSMADAATLVNLEYEDFIDELVHLAIQRYKNSPVYASHLTRALVGG
jgi:D-alanine-D-alanine ligase